MENGNHGKSRRKTVWDGRQDMTAPQSFIREKITEHYSQRHPTLKESGEADIINFYVPRSCPFCGSRNFRKFGKTKNRIQRYQCLNPECSRTFTPTTGTIFDEHRVSVSEWIEYLMNLFRYVSISSDSWNNRNSFMTSRYWLQKVFIILENTQNSIIFENKVRIDETYFSVRKDDIVFHSDGSKLRGISKNQLCIAAATDGMNTIYQAAGNGRMTKRQCLKAYAAHLQPNITIVHDGEESHEALVKSLGLISEVHLSKDTIGLDGKENPMYPINHQHSLLKKFLYAHSGFLREHLQGYLDLFDFAMNPPKHSEEKVERFFDLAFSVHKVLRYRDFWTKEK